MYLLAMDCAGPACSVALLKGRDSVAWRHEAMSRGQSERLVPMIDNVLGDASITASQLDRIAVTIGPGAFTGIRIGLASARAMALALDIPAVGVTTFDATMQAFTARDQEGETDPVVVILETKRKDYYAQMFAADGAALSAGTALDATALLDQMAGQNFRLIGDGAKRFFDNALKDGTRHTMPDSKGYTAIDVANRALDLADAACPPRPLYLRPPDVTVKPSG